ncbi:hypothetical protein [Erythrobacter sp. THAF29]|uniref:hypothetical protein n=1 Tax=Erythrobacter sp. THAF29 TaxID=2587851 RepID=UPI0012684B7F|nr:hypothetical protein [Erythrobacter sp. THAF29]
MTAAKVGGGAWLLSLSMYLVLIASGQNTGTWLVWFNYAIFLLFFAALIVQFRNRNADEFTAQQWGIASSTAFIVTVGWMLFAGQIEAIVGGIISQATGKPFQTSYALWWAFQMPMLTFYAVFFFRQFRESR